MDYDKELIAGKLRHWEDYLLDYKLPGWEEIPDFGLYMEQVIVLMKQYLDYQPPELKDEQIITAATINNYVRKKIMPEPVRKRYYRSHIAYLIMICSLKQSLSINLLQKIIPMGLEEAELRERYTSYLESHRRVIRFFVREVKLASAKILDYPAESDMIVEDAEQLVMSSAVISGLARLLAEKLILLEGRTLAETPEDEVRLHSSRPSGAES